MKKGIVIAALLLGMALLAGCGDAPYELTEDEQAIIVGYSSHIVSKYNNWQRDGLIYISREPETPDVSEEPWEEPYEEPEASGSEEEFAEAGEEPAAEEGIGSEEEDIPAQSYVTFDEIYAGSGISVSYAGYELHDAYVKDAAYAIESPLGKQCLVVNFDIFNTTDQDLNLDNMVLEPKFRLKCNDDTGNRLSVSAELTLLLNDFSTYEGVVKSQAVEPAVLLFLVPDTVSAVDGLELEAKINGEVFNIFL